MADDDFSVEVGAAVRRHISRRSNPLEDPGKVVAPYDSPDTDPIPVFISEEVMKAIEQQTLADKEREVGGVLLGGFYRNDKGSFVEVTDFVEAESAKGTDVSLTFTHETWEHIHERIALRGQDLQIVGWYHSHPGLGVFMSKEDEFIHTSFFSDPWHVAIVHDPIYSNWGCFKWVEGKLDRAGGFYVFTEKSQTRRVRDFVKNQLAKRQAPGRSASSSADRLARPASARTSSVWIAVVVMLMIQLVVWRVAMPKRGPASVGDDYQTALQLLRISDLSGAEECLRRELSIHPDNVQAFKDLRALNRVLSNPSIANQEFDRENQLLFAGGQLAAEQDRKGKSVSRSQPRTSEDQFKRGASGRPAIADYAGGDPLKVILDEYESAATTRAARIGRAKAVDKAAKMWWSSDAVEWLNDEELRQIAYGKTVTPLAYSDRYKSLPAVKKKIVDEVFGSKK